MPTEFFQKTNNGVTSIAAPRASGAPSIAVADGSVLPSAFPFRLSIFREQAAITILRITAKAGNTLTTDGPIEGLADADLEADDVAANVQTAGDFQDLEGAVNDVETGLAGKADDPHTHAASSIVSGTLPIVRGGTGRNALTADRLLAGDGTDPVRLITLGDNLSFDGDTLNATGGGGGGGDLSEAERAALDFSRVSYGHTLRGTGSLPSGWIEARGTWVMTADGAKATAVDSGRAIAVRNVGHNRPHIVASLRGASNNNLQPALVPLWVDADNYIYIRDEFGGIRILQVLDGTETELALVSLPISRNFEISRLHVFTTNRGTSTWVSAWFSVAPTHVAVATVDDATFTTATHCGIGVETTADRFIFDFVVRRGGLPA